MTFILNKPDHGVPGSSGTTDDTGRMIWTAGDHAKRVLTDETLATIEWCLQWVAEANGDPENEAEAAAALAVVKSWKE